MQLRHLKTFVTVASTLNITRAAEQVHLAQSSVTEQIQALEADLGAPLFDRSRRALRLTEAGRRLLDYADDLLAFADEARAAVADAAGAVSGMLTIGSLETLCASRLTPLLTSFGQAHAAVGLQLNVAGSGELRSAVGSGAIDVCFVFGEAGPDPDLQSETIANERLVVIMPPGHRFAGVAELGPADLVGEPFLVTQTACVYRQMFEKAFPLGSPDRPRLAGEFQSLAAIRSLVERGLGCALVPRLVVHNAAGSLPHALWRGGQETVPVTMIWRRRRIQPPILRLFLDTTRLSFGAVQPGDGALAVPPA